MSENKKIFTTPVVPTTPISMDITLPKGYFVANMGTNKNNNIKGISKLVSKLEKVNKVLTIKAIEILMSLDNDTFKIISQNLLLKNKAIKGEFLRPSFASGEDISEEVFTFDDFMTQMEMYFFTYSLGIIPGHMLNRSQKRKIEVDNIVTKKEKKELNCTFKIIDVKTTDEFIKDVAVIIGSPIVFGKQQLEFISEAYNKNLLTEVFNLVQNIKVKENIFAILEITGKEIFKNLNILRTPTDVLRYAYFASDLNYRKLEKGVKFNLKTSDKKVIMSNLNKIAEKNIANVFGEMRPYKSQWLSLSKNLFPGSKKFSNFYCAQTLFDNLRNNTKIETFNTITEKYIRDKNFSGLAVHLSEKPGELLRNMDMIIRNSNKSEIAYLIDIIKSIKLNPKLIIQVMKWLEYRIDNDFSLRTFNVKGKPVTIENKPLKKLKKKRTKNVTESLRDNVVNHLRGKDLFSKEIAYLEDINKISEEDK